LIPSSVNNNLINISGLNDYANAAWGDYDNDGDLDIIIQSEIYNNQNGIFTNINANLINIMHGSVAWGDYDNDNDLDLLMTGISASSISNTKIYRNDNGTFIDINAPLTNVWNGNGEWGDYDNDGDLDVLIAGQLHNNSSPPKITEIYVNNSNIFSLAVSLTGINYGVVTWDDYDNDNDLDVLISGFTQITNIPFTELFRNDGNNIFVNSGNNFTPLAYSHTDFIDYNNDGKLDIMTTGLDITSSKTEIYLNNGSGIFNLTAHNFIDLHSGSFDWGDYDNDGKMDLIISGINNTSGYSFNVKIYNQKLISDLSIHETYDKKIILYPNPTNKELFINNISGHYELIGIDGRIIKQGEIHSSKNSISLEDIAEGVYFLKINDGKIEYLEKIIKQ